MANFQFSQDFIKKLAAIPMITTINSVEDYKYGRNSELYTIKFEMQIEEFLKMINIIQPKMILYDNFYFFIIHEGSILKLNTRFRIESGNLTWESALSVMEAMMKTGETDPNNYWQKLKILEEYGIETIDNIYPFVNSEFLRASDLFNALYNSGSDKKELYNAYKEAKRLGITKLLHYVIAKECGISDGQDFLAFISSPFYNEPRKLKPEERDALKTGYSNFKIFQKSGFIDVGQFKDAQKKGFNDQVTYADFLSSGASSKEQYEYIKTKLQTDVNDLIQKAQTAQKDADDLYKSGHYDVAIQKIYLSFEKAAQAISTYHNKTAMNNYEFNPIDGFYAIFSENEIPQIKKDELHYWRKLRIDITHENMKVDASKADQALNFFTELLNQINKKLNQMILNKNK